MKYLVGIPYRNRRDLLLNALHSIQIYWPHTVVVDDSEHSDLQNDPEIATMVSVYEPCVPLSFTQSMNLFKKWAEERECDAVIYMHNDGEAYDGSAQAFLNVLEQLKAEGKRWGLAHTDSHAIIAYSVEAMRIVGWWDINLPNYFTDIDYHRRLLLAGYEEVGTSIPVLHHGSSTVKSDPELHFLNSITFELHHQYYEKKWGGKMGQETFNTPFDR